MSDAPKRICAFPDYNDHTNPVSEDWDFGNWDSGICVHRGTEYIRADLHAAEVEALRKENERLRDVFDTARAFDEALDIPGANVGSPRLAMHKAIRAALQGETD